MLQGCPAFEESERGVCYWGQYFLKGYGGHIFTWCACAQVLSSLDELDCGKRYLIHHSVFTLCAGVQVLSSLDELDCSKRYLIHHSVFTLCPCAQVLSSLDELDCGKRYLIHHSVFTFCTCAQVLSALDELDCGKRYLCELASLPPADLSPEEQRTLAVFTVSVPKHKSN